MLLKKKRREALSFIKNKIEWLQPNHTRTKLDISGLVMTSSGQISHQDPHNHPIIKVKSETASSNRREATIETGLPNNRVTQKPTSKANQNNKEEPA
jgi:hypothetical protein